MAILPSLLLFGAACGLAYLREIDRLERDLEPSRSGKKLLPITLCALVICLLFTLWSFDAGLILLVLTAHLFAVLAGVSAGQKLAWMIYRKRNPDLFEDE